MKEQKNFQFALKHSIQLPKKGDLVLSEASSATQDLHRAGKYNVGPMGISHSMQVTCEECETQSILIYH